MSKQKILDVIRRPLDGVPTVCLYVLLSAFRKYRAKGTIISYCLFCEETVTDSRTSVTLYRGADKSLARATSRCILFDGENICFDASLVIYICIYIYIYIYTHIYK